MERVYCQSCGMPMDKPELFGTNNDGTKNEDYCVYCFKDGEFIKDLTMDEMIETCLGFIDEFNVEKLFDRLLIFEWYNWCSDSHDKIFDQKI